MKRVLIFSFSNLRKDPRVRRQIELLKPYYQITAAGFEDPEIEDIEFVKTPFIYHQRPLGQRIMRALSFVGLRQYEHFYWTIEMHEVAYKKLKSIIANTDLILANDLDTLPLSVRLAKEEEIPLFFDAHEYAPKEFEDLWKWRLIQQPYKEYLCRKYLPQTSAMSTVCQGIAEAYQKNFKVNPLVFPNAAYYRDLSMSTVSQDKIRMIHHGASIISRKLEDMIKMMSYLDQRFHLDFMLLPTQPEYYRHLQKLAAKDERIRFIPPVPTDDIIPFCNQYDIGLCLVPPVNFNYKHGLPNKLFEFIQSRLAVAIGPLPEMSKIVNKYGCGIVAKDFKPESLAAELLKLTPEQLTILKRNTNLAARELAFENFQALLLQKIEALMIPSRQRQD